MTREAAKELAKSMLPAYLSGKGIDIRRLFHCLSASHADHHPSMSYRPKTNTVQCYGCGEHGDIFDVVRMEYGLDKGDYPAIFAKTYQVLGIEPELQAGIISAEHDSPAPQHDDLRDRGPDEQLAETDYTDFFREAAAHVGETEYARRRGLSSEVIQRFHLGYASTWQNPALPKERQKRIRPSPRLIIPTSPCSYIARDTRASLSRKQRPYAKLKVGHVHIFNADVLAETNRPIFITEGEFDALSIETVGGRACALGSTSMVCAFLKELEAHRPKVPLIIALDRDAPGLMAKDRLVRGLNQIGIAFACANISGEWKDANEALVADKEVFQQSVLDAEEIAMELTENENLPEKENLVHDMNQTLREMKQQPLGLVDFWEKAIDTIKETLLDMQEAATACNILRVWSAGLDRAGKEFGRKDNPAVQDIKREAEEMLASGKASDEWKRIFELISDLDRYTNQFLQAMREKPHENPLLTIPAIREAEPISKSNIQTASPARLYFSAVKRVVLQNDAVSLGTADVAAVRLLEQAKVKDSVICQGLMESPRLQKRGEAERKAAIIDWMKHRKAERTAGR